jgi:uncharacterized membrane protein (UPF0127 family)
MAKPHFLQPMLAPPQAPVTLRVERTGAVLAASVEGAFDSASRRRGLLGRDSLADDAALIIAPCSSIHTFGMRFPIDVVFVNRQGHVVKTRADMPGGRLVGALRAFAAIELAAGAIDRVGVQKGDQLVLDTHAATPSTGK